MSANERQPGGSHYSAALQHWDVCERYGIGYLESAATKYLTRLDKKGTPLLDAEKPGHYVEKLIELALEIGRGPRGVVPAPVIAEFLRANGVDGVRGAAITLLLGRWTVETLRVAADLIDAVLVDVRKTQATPTRSADILPFPGKPATPYPAGAVVIPDPLAEVVREIPKTAVVISRFHPADTQSAPVAAAVDPVQAVRQERGKDPLARALRLEDDGSGELKARAVPIVERPKVPHFPSTLGIDAFNELRPVLREFYKYDATAGEYVLVSALRDAA